MAYKAIVKGHEVVVSLESSGEYKLYIDGDLRDIFKGDPYSSTWRTLLRGSIFREDGHKAVLEFQIRASGIFSVLHRLVLADQEVIKWKNGKRVE